MTDHDTLLWVTKLIIENKTDDFYNSRMWRKKRAVILKEQHYECQRCKARGKYKRAVIVHHIKHLKEHPELALVDSNLEAVCFACHEELHPEKQDEFRKRYTKKLQLNEERW